MSTPRWARASFALFVGYFAAVGGCGGDDAPPGADGGGGAGGAGGACSPAIQVTGCNTVSQNGVNFDLECSGVKKTTINNRAVCAVSGQCNGSCLDPTNVLTCLECTPDGGKRDGGSGPLGAACTSNSDCGGGLTCFKSSDDVAPGGGAPNGLCTVECTNSAAACSTYGAVCVQLDALSTKAYCLEDCEIGANISKCHDRRDMACSPLDKGFACVPLCRDDGDCGTRKCDLAKGLCSTQPTPGLPIGASCTKDADCAGDLCVPLDEPGSTTPASVCSARCRVGVVAEGCGYRSGAVDAGPVMGGCYLLWDQGYDEGDLGLCMQLCDGPGDCLLKVPSWTCTNDTFTRSVFKHGVCFFGDADAGTTTDAGSDARSDASIDVGSEPPVSVDATTETSNPADTAADTTTTDAESDAPAADGAND
jgi:hypothetical protein